MRFLTAISVVMGILIVAGTAILVIAVIRRTPATTGAGAQEAAAPVVLDEPAGTRIAGADGTADALVLRLIGGGPDRVVVVDARSGRVVARTVLAR